LRDNGLSENGFIQEQKKSLARVFVGDALTAHTPVPVSALEAMHRYGAERRSVEYLTLSFAQAEKISVPTDDILKEYYTQRQVSFRTSEYRSGHVLALTPALMSATMTLTDADVLSYYEQVKAERFGSPEQRSVDQIVFDTAEQAQAAFNKIAAGSSFEVLAKDQNLTPESLTLGTVTKAQIFDPAVAQAAFSLAKDQVSAPVAGRFGSVLVRVSQIVSENITPFDKVKADLQKELSGIRAREQINDLHDKIEDQRAGARSLGDIAKELNISLISLGNVTRQGKDKAGENPYVHSRT
jgi:peptidyl-prolyl cis-trans isomerase D